eukprot:6492722-Amphidinium_carterae.3
MYEVATKWTFACRAIEFGIWTRVASREGKGKFCWPCTCSTDEPDTESFRHRRTRAARITSSSSGVSGMLTLDSPRTKSMTTVRMVKDFNLEVQVDLFFYTPIAETAVRDSNLTILHIHTATRFAAARISPDKSEESLVLTYVASCRGKCEFGWMCD